MIAPPASHTQTKMTTALWLGIILVPIATFSIAPIAIGLGFAFTDARAGGLSEISFTGFDNFIRLGADERFWNSIGLGFLWALSVSSIQFVLSLALALLLNGAFAGRAIFRTIAIVPWAVPPVVVAIIWQLVYHPNVGLLNAGLETAGVVSTRTNWLQGEATVLPAVIVAAVWAGLPQTTLVLLAALQSVPSATKEAAWLDRANSLQVFGVATWPSIRLVAIAIFSLDFISAFNQFGLVFVLTDGSASGALRLPALLAYEEGFRFGEYGYAAAMGLAMVVAVLVVLAISLRLTLLKREQAE